MEFVPYNINYPSLALHVQIAINLKECANHIHDKLWYDIKIMTII